MKKKIIFIVVIILVLAVLIVPFKSDTANDGGTRVYSALTYKAVKWNKLYDKSATGSNPEFYKNTAVYFFPDSFKDIDLLWEKESKKFYKECFGNVGVGRNKNLEIVKIESDIEGITVELKSYDLKAEKPYIELIWKNSRDEEYCFGEYFDILYSEDKDAQFPDGFEHCNATDIAFTDLGYILNPKSEYDMNYGLLGYNLSRNEGIYCMAVDYAWQYYSNENKYIRIFFTLS